MYFFEKVTEKVKKALGPDGIIAFLTTVIAGVICHVPAMLMDAPNHDGLSSIYFDQNMVTSGRWFLGIACGISTYFTIPWVIGILSLIYLGIASVLLVKLLKVTTPVFIVLISALFVSFPVVASMYAYVFTMDGYMIGLMLSVLSVYLVDKSKFGWIFGAVSLAFCMGIYQAYLPVAILLCYYLVLVIFSSEKSVKDKILSALRYLYMGALGSVLYYVILQIMLKIQGKELDTYQGISDMAGASKPGILATLKTAYMDFLSFTIKSHVIFANKIAFVCFAIFAVSFAVIFFTKFIKSGWYKTFWFYIIFACSVILIPLFTNIILFISPSVTYHSLMRYQWIVLIIIPVAFMENVIKGEYSKTNDFISAFSIAALFVMTFSFALSDNIAYSNLQKKYEKTYAYCLRLADRIEQTEGYYQGIPIYMIGVISEDNYPVTDLTEKVTSNILGTSGDYLLYTGKNYEAFMKNYLGISLNVLDSYDKILYYEDWYTEMPNFPNAGSIKIVDGIMCIKTENMIK